MTVDDFEWVELNFDNWYLLHKKYLYACARVTPYHGWVVVVDKQAIGGPALVVDSLDAAKTIAAMLAAQHMEDFPDASNYSKRTPDALPQAVPRGVFKMA
jgi:hypothetical protein